MSIKVKSAAAKALGAGGLAFVAVFGASHLVQSKETGVDSSDRVGNITLASAQPGLADLPDDPKTPQLPATRLRPGAPLPVVDKTGGNARRDPAQNCEVTFRAELEPGSMVRLIAEAPCLIEGRIQFRHDDLRFDGVTDSEGRYSVSVPALSPIAIYEADVDGATYKAIAAIPDFEEYSRVALQWTGQTGLQIHALEFGADYNGAGHVWAEAPQSSMRAVRARGGFLARLGDSSSSDGQMAEIYTFPVGLIQRAGAVRISVEAEVTAQSCGKSVSGQVFQPGEDGRMESTDLTLEMPDCEAIGDFLVLKNLIRDMKIASN